MMTEEDRDRVGTEDEEILEGELQELDNDAEQAGQPEGEQQDLQAELQAALAKAEEYLDGWQRSRAEFANYKRRIEREQAQTYQSAAGSIIKRFLEILDDLERALKNRPEGGDGAGWAAGIELIYRKMISYLEAEGVRRMEAEGQMFDPNFHEAISQEDSPEHQSGQIIEVIQHGYFIGDRVLRPALVRVAR
jgi:molecular chaperone GrpE